MLNRLQPLVGGMAARSSIGAARQRGKRASAGLALLTGMMLTACGDGQNGGTEADDESGATQTPASWRLIWSDEFDGGALDTAKWNIQTGDGTAEGVPGWGNKELQSYQADNVTVADGNLIITARREPADGQDYTSGRINTATKLDLLYGRAEARIHVPGGRGLWSAFWLLPTDYRYGGWAASGEIDIMEVYSRHPNPFTQGALHYGMTWPLNTYTYTRYSGIDPSDGFHTYAAEWDAEEIRWFVDGNHFMTVTRATYWTYYKDQQTNAHVSGGASAPFDQPFHLLLNLAVGGNLPEAPVPEAFPGEMRVDYVRVYTCDMDTETGLGCAGLIDKKDPSVTPAPPEAVYRAVYDLYKDKAGPLLFPDSTASVALELRAHDADGALMLSEMNTGDDRGLVMDINTTGGSRVSIIPTGGEPLTLFGMTDPSEPANLAGELQFDLYVFGAETDPQGKLRIKLDDGSSHPGFLDIPVNTLAMDEWTTVTVQIGDLVSNGTHANGKPVDLSAILGLFVLEPDSLAHVRLDNIRIICAHPRSGECGIAPLARATTP